MDYLLPPSSADFFSVGDVPFFSVGGVPFFVAGAFPFACDLSPLGFPALAAFGSVGGAGFICGG